MKKVLVIVLMAAAVSTGRSQNNSTTEGCITLSANSTCKLLDDNHYEVTQYSESGKVVQVGYYLNGKKAGKWTAYDEQGKKLSEMNYLNGKKEGKTIVWVHDEGIRYEVIYSRGMLINSYAFNSDNDQLIATR
jgi:hypothetical protein